MTCKNGTTAQEINQAKAKTKGAQCHAGTFLFYQREVDGGAEPAGDALGQATFLKNEGSLSAYPPH